MLCAISLEFPPAVPALVPCTLCPRSRAQEPCAAFARGASSTTGLAAALLASSAGFWSVQPHPDRTVMPLRPKVLYRAGGPKGHQNWGLCHLPWQQPACALSWVGQSHPQWHWGHSCSQAVISCGPKHPHCAIPADCTRKMSFHTIFL